MSHLADELVTRGPVIVMEGGPFAGCSLTSLPDDLASRPLPAWWTMFEQDTPGWRTEGRYALHFHADGALVYQWVTDDPHGPGCWKRHFACALRVIRRARLG